MNLIIILRKNHSAVIAAVCFFIFSIFPIVKANAYVVEFPSYYGMDLKFLGTVTETYSNNRTFSADGENIVEDFQTILSLGLNLTYVGKRRAFRLDGTMKREPKFNSNDVQNPSENLTLSYRDELTEHDTISLSNSFSHTKIPQTFEDEFGRITGRFDNQSNNAALQYSKDVSKELNVGTGYSYRLNWADAEGAVDTESHSLNLRSTYFYSAITSFPVRYTYTDSSSDNGNNVTNQVITVGLKRYLTKHFSITVNADMSFSKRGDSEFTRENYSLILDNALLIDKKSSGSISYRENVTILSESNDLFENKSVSLELNRDFLEEFRGSLTFFYGQGEYLLSGSKDELIGGKILSNYNFWQGKKGQSISGRLGYTYSELNSNNESREYSRDTIDFGIVAKF